jgi:hypothetical protein
MSSFFTGNTGSKYISSTKLPASTGPVAWTPNIPGSGTIFKPATGSTSYSGGSSSGGGSSFIAPAPKLPIQQLSMGSYDPNTKTFTDSSGQKYSTADPQKFNIQLVQQKAEQQKMVRQQTELAQRKQILTATGPFKPVEQVTPTGPISSKPVFVSTPENRLAKEILKQDVKSSQTGFVSGSAVIQPSDTYFGVQEKKQTQRDIVTVGLASKTKAFKEARIKSQSLGELTGVDLTGEIDESKIKRTESIISFVGQKSFFDEQKIVKLEAEQEAFGELSKQVAQQGIAEKNFFDKWKQKDLEPDSSEIVLSPEDYDLFVSEKKELDASKSISDFVYDRAFLKIQAREKEVEKELGKQSWVGKDLIARSKALVDVESKFDVFQDVARERIGYDIKDSELKYSPVQRKETGDFGAMASLYKETVFGELPELKKPVVVDDKSFEQLIGYKGRKEYEDVVFAVPDPVDWASRIGTGMVALGTVGAVGGSAVGSSIPFLGTGVGAVAGGIIGLKAGFVAGVSDVIASETVGRFTGDKDIGRTAGMVASIVGAVGASNLFLGKEVAKRTVVDVGNVKNYGTDFLSVETVPKKGFVVPKDTKFVSAIGKQRISVDVTSTLKPSTGKIDLFVSELGKKIGYAPKPSPAKTVTKFFEVGSVSDSATVLTGTKFSRVAVEAGGRMDLVTSGPKDFFITSGKVTSTIVPQGTVRSKIANLVSVAPKKIVSVIRGDKTVVSGFKEKTGIESLGFSNIASGKNWVISDYLDKVGSVRLDKTGLVSGDKTGLTRVASSPDAWYAGKTFFDKDTVIRFVGQYSDDLVYKGLGFSSVKVGSVPKQIGLSPKNVSDTGWLSKSMSLDSATRYLDSMGTQNVKLGAEVAQATVKSVSKSNTQQVMRLAAESGKSSLDSLYGGGIVLTTKASVGGRTAYADEGLLDTVSRVRFGSIPVGVEKVRVMTGAATLTSLDYKPIVIEKEFADTSTLTRVKTGYDYSPLTFLKTDTKIISATAVKQDIKQDTLIKPIEKVRVDTKERIDFSSKQPPIIPFVPTIPVTTWVSPLPSFGRMDAGAGIGRFRRPASTKKSVPLFQVKSDLFRKFVTGEKDIVVSKENIRLIKNIRGKKGSLLGFVPTKELLVKKKKKKKGKWFEEEDNKWWRGFAL